MVIQIGLTLSGGLLFLKFYKREKRDLIQQFKLEAETMIHDNMQGAIDAVGETLGEMFTQPTVKKAFSILGQQGGEARAENALVDEMANDMLDSPQFSAIRMGAEALGLDIEGYIEKHGAIKTLNAAQQLAKVAGIDLLKLDLSQLGNLSMPGAGSNGNPYLRR